MINLEEVKIVAIRNRNDMIHAINLLPLLQSETKSDSQRPFNDCTLLLASYQTKIIGAIALKVMAHSSSGLVTLRCRIPYPDGLSIESKMVKAIAIAAKRRGVVELMPWSRCQANDPRIKRWLQLGFELDTNKHPVAIYNYPLKVVTERFGRVMTLPRLKNKIPPNASIRDISAGDLTEIVNLRVKYIEGSPQRIRAKLLGLLDASENYHHQYSKLLYVDKTLIGLGLVERNDEQTIFYDSTVIKPGWRNGWANSFLKYHVLNAAYRDGLTRCLAAVPKRYADTLALAKRVNAELIEEFAYLQYVVDPVAKGQWSYGLPGSPTNHDVP